MAIDGRVAQLEASEPTDSRIQLTYVEAGEDAPLRRALNFSVAAVALALTAPIMMGIALTIRLTSRRPALFTQTRIGWDRRRVRDRRRGRRSGVSCRRGSDLGGQPFTIFKFRTMRDGPISAAEVWATPDDPRITPLGRVLRQYRLDELPQLVNVLRGDMNLVGPRPEQPSIFAALRDQIPGYHARQRVRPGITGWAQINHRYDQSLDDVQKKLGFDLDYVKRQSTSRDLMIMLRTLPVMLFRRGAH